MQPLQHLVDRKLRRESGHEVDEVLPLEADCPVAVPRREAHAGELPLQLAHGHGEMLLGLDVAASGDVDLRHGRYRVKCGPRPRR